MFRKLWSTLLNAIAIVLLSLFASLSADAQTWEKQCINGKCTWVLVSPASTITATADPVTVSKLLQPRTTFGKVFLEVAEKSYQDGVKATADGKPLAANQISRLDMLRIRLICRNPAKLSQLESAVADQLVADGHVASIKAIDWGGLKDLLLTLLPILIELIKLI